MSTKERFEFVYNGVQYDATEYAAQHPGGLTFLKNMKEVNQDFTEYFRALHSDTAEKILKSFPILSVGNPSKCSQDYLDLYAKLEPLYKPNWIIQILLFILVSTAFIIGCITQIASVSIICFAFSQILTGWIGHSAAHSRDKNLNKFGRIESSLVGGFSMQWWSLKHNMHHMFTNIMKFDEDIQHEYKVYFYPFLYLKWRFDSFVSAIKMQNYVEIATIGSNYAFLIIFRQNFLYWVIAQLASGFYSAFVLIGNHEREQRYDVKPNISFVDHQIITCRNYREENLFWLIMMGGMQFQTQHHLFPQIPFYKLPTAKVIIQAELAKKGKTFIYGPVI